MATPALYRRYRPRRFSELKGQEHIVRSLQTALQTGREGQAYLFSGPRGTGKTSTARILAKALNCENLDNGEPCCVCASCLAIEAGTSYDVHELDAASNNGVDAMRDLIERSMLGTPGRHKVYILDEVHMLSKGAEAALLKTLEEPPPHVVFVLATTDPQKVSETIRSRCQPLQFHLLPMDVMEGHVRWLIGDAGLTVGEAAIEAVLRQGGGSARDTLSALELIATSGGTAPEVTPLDEFVESLIEHDPARALTAVAASLNLGRDPRTLADELVGHLRDCFLSLMAPELVVLPDRRATEVAALAVRLGAAGAVRAIETIGSTLVEMRHAPDPRVLLEVALVKLTNVAAETGVGALAARLERLEQRMAGVGPVPSAATATASPAPSHAASPTASPAGAARSARPVGASATPPPAEAAGRPALGGRLGNRVATSPDPRRRAGTPEPAPGPAPVEQPSEPEPVAPPAHEAPGPRQPPAGPLDAAVLDRVWNEAVLPRLRPLVKALYATGRIEPGVGDGVLVTVPAALRHRAEEHRAAVETVMSDEIGRPIGLVLAGDVVGDAPGGPRTHDAGGRDSSLPPEEDVDLSELTDAPAEPRLSGIERVAAAFPGAQLIDEDR